MSLLLKSTAFNRQQVSLSMESRKFFNHISAHTKTYLHQKQIDFYVDLIHVFYQLFDFICFFLVQRSACNDQICVSKFFF